MRIEYRADFNSDDYARNIQAKLLAGVRAGVRAAGQDAVTQIKKKITETTPRAPIDTGLLRTSITSTPDADGLATTVGPAPPAAERGAVMELGRRPNGRIPPLDPIFQWVHRKGLASRFLAGRLRELAREKSRALKVSRGGKKLSLGKKAINRDVELSLAFAIRRSIAKKGIRPRRFMEKAGAIIKSRFPLIVRDAIDRALRGPPPPPTP